MRRFAPSCPLMVLPFLAASSSADVVTLTPVADAFVSSLNPTNNYGGAGALAVAAPGLPNGEFRSLMRFDTSSAVATFDASFGAGQWTVQSVTLALTSANPMNVIFNAVGAGQCVLTWQQRDDWIEGTGGPNLPGTTGVTFNDLAGLTSPGDEVVGTYDYDGSTSGVVVRSLTPTTGFLADLRAGNAVSFRISPSGSTIAYLFNSRNFPTPANNPALAITAVATTPQCYANCDNSTVPPILNVNDFTCFLNTYAAGNTEANCDASTTPPILNVNDFTCFLNRYAAGCP